jgi:DNA-binding transcriptional MocR family regulator
MEAISDLPMDNDIDADYSPQYVKLARAIRAKIESGDYRLGEELRSVGLARQYNVSLRVVWHALAILAANRYVNHPGNFSSYRVIWKSPALWPSALRGCWTELDGSKRRPFALQHPMQTHASPAARRSGRRSGTAETLSVNANLMARSDSARTAGTAEGTLYGAERS